MVGTETSLVDDIDPGLQALPPAKKSASSRVAQLGAKIKSVATSERSKVSPSQKRPAPALPQEVAQGGERAHVLNKYILSKSRGEVSFLKILPLISKITLNCRLQKSKQCDGCIEGCNKLACGSAA